MPSTTNGSHVYLTQELIYIFSFGANSCSAIRTGRFLDHPDRALCSAFRRSLNRIRNRKSGLWVDTKSERATKQGDTTYRCLPSLFRFPVWLTKSQPYKGDTGVPAYGGLLISDRYFFYLTVCVYTHKLYGTVAPRHYLPLYCLPLQYC